MNRLHISAVGTVAAIITSLLGGAPAAVAVAPRAVSVSVPEDAWSPPDEVLPPEEQASAGVMPDEPWRPDIFAGPEATPPADASAKSSEQGASAQPEAGAGAMPMAAPAGTPVGAPGLGEQPWFSFQDFSLTSTDTVRVNLANGNLLVKARDLSVAAPGYGLSVDRFYNGLSSIQGRLGGGWGLNNGYDMGLSFQPTFVDYHAPNGGIIRFQIMGSGSSTTYVAPPGANLQLIRGSGGSTGCDYAVVANTSAERACFSVNGYLVSQTDRNGVGVSVSRVMGRPSEGLLIVHSNRRYLATTPDASNPSLYGGFEDGSRRGVSYSYDSSQRLTTVTAPDNTVTDYSYDLAGRLGSITVAGSGSGSQAQRTVSFAYDGQSRVTKVTESSGPETGFAYSGGQTVVTDPNGHAATYAVDSSGRVTSAVDALGRMRSQSWTSNNDVATTTDAIGTNVSTFTYDGSGNRTNAQLPTGAAASAAYAIGANCTAPNTGTAFQPKCSTDDAGNKTQYQYDGAGNLLKQTDTTSGTAVTEFERTYGGCGGLAGQVCSTKDGNGNTTTYSYNSYGDLLTVTPPAPSGQTTYGYDSLGRVTSVTDGNGDVTSYTYDIRDRILRTTFDGGQYVDQTYFPSGATKTRSDSVGLSTSYSYDAEGRLTNQTGPHAGTSQSFTYDAVGNMLTYVDSGGTTTYGYDFANQLVTVREPGGSCPASGAPAANSGCVQVGYDQNGAETTRTLPGGATTVMTRDNSGRPTRITAKTGAGATVVDIGYSYTAPGSTNDRANVQTRTAYAEQGVPAGAVTTYSYDSRNRLTLAQEKNGATTTASWGYTYDNVGNRTQQVRSGLNLGTGVTGGTIAYGYNAANELTSTTGQTTTWTYDGAGNQTRNGATGTTAVFGDRGQQTQYGSTAATYMGVGNTDRLSNGSATFTSGALGLMQRTTGSTTQQYTRTPTGTPLGFKTGSRYYFVQDHLGSVVGVFTATGAYSGGYSYSPYGEARYTGTATAVTANPLRYIGSHWDGASIYKLGARYYDTSLGRFTQVDPSGQEANPYAYATSIPTTGADPSGLLTWGETAAALVGVVGGALSGALCTALPLAGCILAGAIFGAFFGAIAGSIQVILDGESEDAAVNTLLTNIGLGAMTGALGGVLGKILGSVRSS